MKKCIYPGSFDPVTLGHIDIVERASKIFDSVIIGVLDNHSKARMFSAEQRLEFVRKATKHIKNVSVVFFDGLLVDFAKQKDCNIIVRGLRSTLDYEYEKSMSLCNSKLYSDIETIFLDTRPELAAVSSSVVREILSFNGDICGFVPESVIEDVLHSYNK